MDENIKHLYEDIINATKNIDNIIKELSKINGPTLCLGCGGSKVVAEYINQVLTKKNKVICKTLGLRDANYIDKDLYQNIIISSYSGSNFGVKNCLELPLKKLLLTSRKSTIKDEILLKYDLEHRHSFISINTTIVPMAILLKYYLGDNFYETLNKIFSSINKDIYSNNINNINIFTGIDTSVPAIFLESTLVEAGITSPTIHYKYDYCHGRSTINKDKKKSTIYLENNELNLDKVLKEVLKISSKEVILIKGISDDEVVNNFFMTLQCLFLLRNVAKSKLVDLSNIKYDKEAVKKLYYFKGSM